MLIESENLAQAPDELDSLQLGTQDGPFSVVEENTAASHLQAAFDFPLPAEVVIKKKVLRKATVRSDKDSSGAALPTGTWALHHQNAHRLRTLLSAAA